MSLVHFQTSRLAAQVAIFPPRSSGFGPTALQITDKIENISKPTPTFSGGSSAPQPNLPEKLFDALASFKIRTAKVAMHLDRDWRSKLFSQLDSLLAAEDWDIQDLPPLLSSYTTFLRLLIFLNPGRRPGLGATSEGHLIATWTTTNNDRLTIECLPQDLIRWNLTASIGDEKERAAAVSPVSRVQEVLGPYTPIRWFADGKKLPPR